MSRITDVELGSLGKDEEVLLLLMRFVGRKPAFYIYENKLADQLRGNRAANQRLCFR